MGIKLPFSSWEIFYPWNCMKLFSDYFVRKIIILNFRIFWKFCCVEQHSSFCGFRPPITCLIWMQNNAWCLTVMIVKFFKGKFYKGRTNLVCLFKIFLRLLLMLDSSWWFFPLSIMYHHYRLILVLSKSEYVLWWRNSVVWFLPVLFRLLYLFSIVEGVLLK